MMMIARIAIPGSAIIDSHGRIKHSIAQVTANLAHKAIEGSNATVRTWAAADVDCLAEVLRTRLRYLHLRLMESGQRTC